jgi:hypothetical protein
MAASRELLKSRIHADGNSRESGVTTNLAAVVLCCLPTLIAFGLLALSFLLSDVRLGPVDPVLGAVAGFFILWAPIMVLAALIVASDLTIRRIGSLTQRIAAWAMVLSAAIVNALFWYAAAQAY